MSQPTPHHREESPLPERITRVIDFRIPLPYLLSAAGFVMWALISMWFALQGLTREVAELQTTIKASISSNSAINSDIALIKFRLDNIENDRARQNGTGSNSPPRR
jgi:hypothetical protein